MSSARMKIMKKCAVLLVLLLTFGAIAASAQEPSSLPSSDETYQFILAKLAAEDGHFDDALAAIDKLVARHPENTVLLYERAMVRIDAGRRDDAESDLRKVVAANATFYDAQRVLGRMILDRAGSDRSKVEEALPPRRAPARGHLSEGRRMAEGRGSAHAAHRRGPRERRFPAAAGLSLPPRRRCRKGPRRVQAPRRARPSRYPRRVLPGRIAERSQSVRGSRPRLPPPPREDARRSRPPGQPRPEPGRPA